jgi:hypothetical protein
VGACGKVVVKALYYQPEGREFETDEVNEFFILPSPSGSTSPGDFSASNIKEYQKQKNHISGE